MCVLENGPAQHPQSRPPQTDLLLYPSLSCDQRLSFTIFLCLLDTQIHRFICLLFRKVFRKIFKKAFKCNKVKVIICTTVKGRSTLCWASPLFKALCLPQSIWLFGSVEGSLENYCPAIKGKKEEDSCKIRLLSPKQHNGCSLIWFRVMCMQVTCSV